MADNIDILITDKIDGSISTKLDSIANAADLAHNAVDRLKASLALINSSALNTLQTAANQATSAINANAMANQKLSTEQQRTALATAKVTTEQQRLSTETQKTATVTQRLSTEQQRTATATAQAAAANDRAALAALRLQQAQDKAGQATHAHGQSWLSMATSMAAGMLMARAIMAVMEGVRFATLGSIEAIDDFQQAGIQMAAILTSLAQDQSDIPGTYLQSRQYAEELNGVLQKVDANTSLNLKNLQSISQEMAKQGVTLDTTDKQQIENYTKIANAVAVYSRNGKDERQVRQEIAALLRGETRQGDELAKLLDRITHGHLKEMITEWKRVGVETGNQGYAINKLGEALSGFGPASQELQGTWGAVTSSISTAANILQRAFFKPIFSDIVGSGETFAQWLKDNEKTVEHWGINFLRIVYNISAEILRLGMLVDKAGGTGTSAQMLLYGPGKALGVKSSTERFDRAAQNNIEFENRYKEKDKSLTDLAEKMKKLDEKEALLNKKTLGGTPAPKLSAPGPTDKEITEAARQLKAYSGVVDQFKARIADTNPDLSRLEKSLADIDTQVNAGIRTAPKYANSIREWGQKTKDSIIEQDKRTKAMAEFRTETKLTEEAIKDMADNFAGFSKVNGSQVGMGMGLMPTGGLLNWKPKNTKPSLLGPEQSGFRQDIPTEEELLRLNKSRQEIELIEAAFRLHVGEGNGIDAVTNSLGHLLDGYKNVLETLSNDFGEFFVTLDNGFADSIGRAIVYGDSLKDSLQSVAQEAVSGLISSLVKLGIQYTVNAALGQSIAAGATAASAVQAGNISAAWAPAAAMVSLATEGANSIPANAAMIQTVGLSRILASIPGFSVGGYTGDASTGKVAGVVHGREFVVNADGTAKNRELLEFMNAGGTVSKSSKGSAAKVIGGVSVNIENYGTSKSFDVEQLSEGEIRIIARDEAKQAVYTHSPKAIANEIRNPNSTVSKSLSSHTQTQRKR